VVLNEESKRETPAIVCFGDKQRFIGTAGAASSTMNPKNSISQIKRPLGRKFSDPELQSDLASFSFRVTEGPGGFPLVHVRFLGEERTFTPTQLFAMAVVRFLLVVSTCTFVFSIPHLSIVLANYS
jgi:heat shock protein 4